MPEGDTIHRWAAQLDEALAGHALTRFELRRDPRGNRLPQPSTRITSVEARGKHLLIHFDDGATLHTHMELHGRWDVYRRGQRWKRPAHTARAVIRTENGVEAVCFDAPIVELRRADHETAPTRASRSLAALGADLCVPGVDLDAVMARLDNVDASEMVADVLLDQRIAAGIGNVYKSEICWACRVHPFAPLAIVDAATRRALYETGARMLQANLDASRRVTYRDGLAVYGKTNKPCPRCRTLVAQAYGGDTDRTTFWCPNCQRAPADPAAPADRP